LNERVFRRGHSVRPCPLRLCVGASNVLPDDDSLAAFADRFLVRVFVDPIPDPRIEELLDGGWQLAQNTPGCAATVSDIDAMADVARRADLTGVRPRLALYPTCGSRDLLSDRRAEVKLIGSAPRRT
jgi:MoxR-like ATPase